MIAIAPTRPATWVLAPACSATAVREPLVETGNPWNRPAATFAEPIPIISWFPRIRSPAALGEGRRGRDRVHQCHEGDAERTRKELRDIGQRHVGDRERREPLRQRTDHRNTVVHQIEGLDRHDREDHDDQHGRHLRHRSLQDEDQAQRGEPDQRGDAHHVTVGDPLNEAGRLVDQAVGVHGESEQLRELSDQDREGETVHVADLRGLREQVGDEPEMEHPRQDRHRTDDQRERRRERDRPVGIAVGQQERGEGRGDHGPEGRIGTQDQDAGRAEHGVPEQTQDGRVQTRDRGQSRELRVRHALRHEQRRQDQARDEVLRQPRAVIGAERLEAWNDGRDRHSSSASSHSRAFAFAIRSLSDTSGQDNPRPWIVSTRTRATIACMTGL